ncbi:MAG: hypothetical protein AAF585_08710 [Verrucomicrobiota bacterium]
MTATPKETKYTFNTHYFVDPIYSYSLKRGIADGFLAPYKVAKIYIDKGTKVNFRLLVRLMSTAILSRTISTTRKTSTVP